MTSPSNTPEGHCLTGIQLNCRSVNTGLAELKLLIYRIKPDFVLLCETWLNNHSKNIPKFCNYVAEWKHRPDGLGGGLCILIKQTIQYTVLNINSFPRGVLEQQAIEIHCQDRRKVVITRARQRSPPLPKT